MWRFPRTKPKPRSGCDLGAAIDAVRAAGSPPGLKLTAPDGSSVEVPEPKPRPHLQGEFGWGYAAGYDKGYRDAMARIPPRSSDEIPGVRVELRRLYDDDDSR